MLKLEIRRERGKNICHLNEKAEEDQKEAKEAEASYNAQTAGHRCHVTRQRDLLAVYHLLNLNWLKNSGKKALFLLLG